MFEKPEIESTGSKLESAFTKLGNTIGRLFSGSSEESASKEGESTPPPSDDTTAEDAKGNETMKEVIFLILNLLSFLIFHLIILWTGEFFLYSFLSQ